MSTPETTPDPQPPVEPATVLGLFLGFFAMLVLVAIAFTTTTRGQVTNAVCGGLLLAIAGGLLRIGRRR